MSFDYAQSTLKAHRAACAELAKVSRDVLKKNTEASVTKKGADLAKLITRAIQMIIKVIENCRDALYFDATSIFSFLSRFEVFLIPTKFGCWRLIFQIILAYTKFNGFEKPPIARSKLVGY